MLVGIEEPERHDRRSLSGSPPAWVRTPDTGSSRVVDCAAAAAAVCVHSGYRHAEDPSA